MGSTPLAGTTVQYKPFHNQLEKPAFATLMRTALGRALEKLSVEALRFSPQSPFARFGHIRILDGTSFAEISDAVTVWPRRASLVARVPMPQAPRSGIGRFHIHLR